MAIASAGPATLSPAAQAIMAAGPIGRAERAQVVRVVDGDTIVVDHGHGSERLRYIGMDTPESVKPDTPVQFMAEEAAAANAELVAGQVVVLERDVSERDQYGRLLRYVWVTDARSPSGLLLVNLVLVEWGLARIATFPPDVRYADAFLAAQRSARDQGLGLWGEPTSSP